MSRNIEIQDMLCCAAIEINGLDEFKGDSKKAMLDFCVNYDNYDDYYGTTGFSDPGAFVIFTGIVKIDDNKYDNHSKDPYREYGTSYGQSFADFIVKNKLGQVVRSVARRNRVNHPNHFVRVWVWAPNYTNLRKWYKENK